MDYKITYMRHMILSEYENTEIDGKITNDI